MNGKRNIIIFWALFSVPTLIMAAMACFALIREQEQISQSSGRALMERAQTASQTIHLTVESIQENLTRSLLDLQTKDLEPKLTQWEFSNPLVRNVFVFYSPARLAYPYAGNRSTIEERRFVSRYESFFTGRMKFDYNTVASENQAVPKTADRFSSGKKSEKSAKFPSFEARKKLIALSKVKTLAARQSAQQGLLQDSIQAPVRLNASGWIPWFSENRLFILGWAHKFKDGPVYGVELELMTLLSRLTADFPEVNLDGAAIVLMDGNNDIMHRSGKLSIEPDMVPKFEVAVSPLLPHWRISVYMDSSVTASKKGILYPSFGLVGGLVTALIAAGVILSRTTLENMRQAQQKTSFVASVSHELKTPLTSIRMYAELLASGRIKVPEKRDNYLSVIVNESHRLTRLINNVLDFGRLEQGKKKYHLTRFDLDALLKDILSAHDIRARKAGVTMNTVVKDGDFYIVSDKDALEQVILNLLDNALKYASDGGKIDFELERSGKDVLLKVKDAGPGIPAKHQKKIFEKFHRVDSSLTAVHPGSGLGLSIARQLIEDLGGRLTYEEPVEKGSCFIIRIGHSKNLEGKTKTGTE